MSRPNFIVILADDLGTESDGSYNLASWSQWKQPSSTPHLQKMTKEGKQLLRMYAGPACCASRAALNSGLLPTHPQNGVFLNNGAHASNDFFEQPQTRHHFAPSVTTLAQVLQSNGYRTGLAGKYLTKENIDPAAADFPLNRGYDLFYEGGSSTKRWRYRPLTKKRDPYLQDFVHPYSRNEVSYISRYQTSFSKKELMTLLLNKTKHLTDALEFAVEHMIDTFTTQNCNDSFFIYWAPHAPHGGFYPRKDLVLKHGGRTREGLIEGLDQAVGRLLGFLRERDLTENTLVLFMSDNGVPSEYANQSILTGCKGNLYEGGAKVPAVAWWPQTVASGTRSPKLLQNIDVMPTLLDLANITAGSHTDGVSFKELLLGLTPSSAQRERIFYQFPTLKKPWSVALDRRFKIIFDYQTRTWRLFHLKYKPLETSQQRVNFQSLKKKWKKQVRRLCNYLLKQLLPTRATPGNWLLDIHTGEMVDMPTCAEFQ